MVVQVRIAHRRTPQDHRLVKQTTIPIRCRVKPLEEVTELAYAIGANLIEFHDALRFAAVMRGRMESPVRTGFRHGAVRRVTPGFEGNHARHVGLECEHLQIEHQLHVFTVGIRDACRCSRQLLLPTIAVAFLDHLNAALDFAHVFEIAIHTLAIDGAELLVDLGDFGRYPVENARVRLAPCRTFLCRSAGTE